MISARSGLVVFAVSITAGCALAPPITLPQAETICESVQFQQYGACLRHQLDSAYPQWRSNREADLVDIYIAWLEAAGLRAQSGEMAQADARLGAAMLRSRLYAIRAERTAVAQQVAADQMLAGLALLNAGRPQPMTPNMITCNTHQMGASSTTTCY